MAKPLEIDERDVGTPDDWVPRHPELVRLTGRHPLNCEPPLKYTKSFLTPNELHYVRSHGAVPKLEWQSHRFVVDGLVGEARSFTMDDFVETFRDDMVTLPVLLVCAGNRRKEQNMIKKTIGFSWGASGLSTAEWTGVPLHVVLERCGVDRSRVKWVWFEGAEPLPKAPYGTCIPAGTALNPACDVIVAVKMNGELLPPDHGFPVRIIVPGHIGGRMVKWLARIHVSEVESSNHHHIHDNRVLPSHVDAETATAEKWWDRPDYAIQELNINSAVFAPAHEEKVALPTDEDEDTETTIQVSGYAYTGGGRKIIRVEVTVDDGATWRLCSIHRSESPRPSGKYWCWVHYSLDLPLALVAEAREICVRAWDSSMNTQPQFPTWNVMGMMNNPWFRVRVHRGLDGDDNSIVFEHPTNQGGLKGGWMTPQRIVSANHGSGGSWSSRTPQQSMSEPAAALSNVSSSSSISSSKYDHLPWFTPEEVATHATKDDCWFICRGLVYDATPFLGKHPGGATSILLCAGTDCTDEFESIHSTKAWAMLEEYAVGRCTSSNDGATTATNSEVASDASSVADDETDAVALKGAQKVPLVLIEKRVVSHDSRTFRFALPAKRLRLGLPVGNHVLLYAKIKGKTVVRAYTPISSESDEDRGFVSFLIKVYFAGQNPAHPEGGLFSQFLDDLHLGSSIEVKGPLGHFTYQSHGDFFLEETPHHADKFGFIAGGTGITPVFQTMRAILEDPEDETEVAVVYCVRAECDLLLHDELLRLRELKPAKCRFYFAIGDGCSPELQHQSCDESQGLCEYGSGRISQELIEHVIGADASHIALCGPEGMIEFACLPALKAIGYDVEHQTTVL